MKGSNIETVFGDLKDAAERAANDTLLCATADKVEVFKPRGAVDWFVIRVDGKEYRVFVRE